MSSPIGLGSGWRARERRSNASGGHAKREITAWHASRFLWSISPPGPPHRDDPQIMIWIDPQNDPQDKTQIVYRITIRPRLRSCPRTMQRLELQLESALAKA